MSETNSAKCKRIKDFIKKGQPKTEQEHFDWSQFEKTLQMKYNEDKNCYEIVKDEG